MGATADRGAAAGAARAAGEVLPAGGHRRMRWRNGGGLTREIARGPAPPSDPPGDPAGGDPEWRISIAEVAKSGPFSSFPGVDRVIVRIGEGGMLLTIDGVEHDLERFSPLPFAGEAEASARLPDGATEDLNVMTRRGRSRADVRVQEVGAGLRTRTASGALLVVVVLEGSIRLDPHAGGVRLGLHDAFRRPGPVDLVLQGSGRVAIIEIETAGTMA